MEKTDRELVDKVLTGDRHAFGILYDRYGRLVHAICFDACRDRDRAADLAQEVFLRAYMRMPGLRRRERFASWIVGIARFVCKEWSRSRRRDRNQYVPDVPERCPDPRREENEVIESLRYAITTLPEPERVALHVFYLQGESVKSVQAALGVSRSGAYKLLRRARDLTASAMLGIRRRRNDSISVRRCAPSSLSTVRLRP